MSITAIIADLFSIAISVIFTDIDTLFKLYFMEQTQYFGHPYYERHDQS